MLNNEPINRVILTIVTHGSNNFSAYLRGPRIQRVCPSDNCQSRHSLRSSCIRQILSIGIHRKNRAIHTVHIFPYRDHKIHSVTFRLFL